MPATHVGGTRILGPEEFAFDIEKGKLGLRLDERRKLMSQKRQLITIGLLWHSMNSDNLGVGALTLSNLEILRSAAQRAGVNARFLIIGWHGTRDHYDVAGDDVEVRPIRTRQLASLSGTFGKTLREVDIVFDMGGGDSFTDIYGPKRFLTIWGAKVWSLLLGKPLILSPQTIGPFERILSRRLARAVISRCRLVVARDTPSARLIEDWSTNVPLIEATDVAMRLPFLAPHSEVKDGTVRVGLNVSGLLFNGGYTRDNQFGLTVNYPELIRSLIRWFIQHPNVALHLIGHVQSIDDPVEDDQRVAEALAVEFPSVQVAPYFSSPVEAKSYIAQMDFFAGARMHAAIAALSAGVPVVPMAYSRKFAGVFGTLGYQHVVDCKSQTAEDIIRTIQWGFEFREELKRDVEAALKMVNERLNAYEEAVTGEIHRIIGDMVNGFS